MPARATAVLSLLLGCASLAFGLGSHSATASPWPSRARPAVVRGSRPLLAVSCFSARNCTAVGGLFSERWNGRRWSFHRVATPASSMTAFDYLSGISCATARACLAVGSQRPSANGSADYDYSPLAELARGNRWSDVSPAPSQTANDYLQAVSCPSASECIAVGQGVAAVLALGWNGQDWTVQLSPANAPGMSILEGVSCPTLQRCIAVGYEQRDPSAPFRPLVERWNGVGWSIMPTPGASATQNAVLNAVSCTRQTCTAVGSVGYRQLVERWSGHGWSIQRAPAGAPLAALNGISCVSSDDCIAVGALTGPQAFHSIAERWNGSRWSLQSTSAPAGGSILWDVSCASRTNCFAVGESRRSPLIEHWTGARWSIQSIG